MGKLAVFGGKSIRDTYLPYGRQFIDEDDIHAVVQTLQSDFLTCGPKVKEFEQALCSLTGANFATAVSNGTGALHVACLAAGIRSGDEVITTPITFAATANAILYCGGTPVFADIDPKTYTIDPRSIEGHITEKTKAIIAVDFTGQACAYDPILEICHKYNLLLIEDAAHSIGTMYRGRPVGQIADLTTFSFHPVKTLTAGEGGAVLAQDPELAKRMELFARHGITRNPQLLQEQANSNWYYEQKLLGYNYRMTDIQCALAISQMEKLDRFVARRKQLVGQYNQMLHEIPEVILQEENDGSDSVRHLYILRLDFRNLSCGRKEIYDALQAENIGVNVHYIPVYFFPYYQQLGYQRGICPNAEDYYETSMTLPLFYSMTDRDQQDVVNAVKKVLGYYRR